MSRLLVVGSVCMALCLMGTGCNKGGQELGQVKGKVTLDGNPLPNAIITFTPESGSGVSTATSDGNGEYELLFINDKGALIGMHKVSVNLMPEAPKPVAEIRSDDPNYDKIVNDTSGYTKKSEPKFKIPERYNTNTTLKREVKSGSNTIDLELKST